MLKDLVEERERAMQAAEKVLDDPQADPKSSDYVAQMQSGSR